MSPGASERGLIFALDVGSRAEAEALVARLRPSVGFFKVGLELFVSEGPGLVRWLVREGQDVFLDLKLYDIPATMRRSVAAASRLGARFITIHDTGAGAAAAREGKSGSRLQVLCVTLLTSVDAQDLRDNVGLGSGGRFRDLEDYVEWRARTAVSNGCDGLICSGRSVRRLRRELGRRPVLVCPGIRLGGDRLDDQKRVVTPYRAVRDGADYLVVGRPIRDAADPLAQARKILAEMDRGLQDRKSAAGPEVRDSQLPA